MILRVSLALHDSHGVPGGKRRGIMTSDGVSSEDDAGKVAMSPFTQILSIGILL